MSQLEYLVALISIIVGLALTDLVQSLRELVRPGRPVRWHWLPLVWALNTFLLLIATWWNSFSFLQEEALAHALNFLPVLTVFLTLYLACAFALPDPHWEKEDLGENGDAEEPLDLEAYYFSRPHRHWFFGALIALLVLSQLISTVFVLFAEEQPLSDLAVSAGMNLGTAAVLAGLALSRRRWAHGTTALLMLLTLGYTLAAGLRPIG